MKTLIFLSIAYSFNAGAGLVDAGYRFSTLFWTINAVLVPGIVVAIAGVFLSRRTP
jgi:hypothetical protein